MTLIVSPTEINPPVPPKNVHERSLRRYLLCETTHFPVLTQQQELWTYIVNSALCVIQTLADHTAGQQRALEDAIEQELLLNTHVTYLFASAHIRFAEHYIPGVARLIASNYCRLADGSSTRPAQRERPLYFQKTA